jgi:hypothetical protein
MEKQPKKSDVGVVKVSMLFAGEKKVIIKPLQCLVIYKFEMFSKY